MKTKTIADNKIILVGSVSEYLMTEQQESTYGILSGYLFFNYKGIQMYDFKAYRKTKSDALEFASKHVESSECFSDGSKPFCIVFYLSGRGWVVLTSNTTTNEHIIRDKMKRVC